MVVSLLETLQILYETKVESIDMVTRRRRLEWFRHVKSVLNLQMTYIIIAHIYEQWDR